jgi:two-component system, NarL family, response regulator
VISAPQISRRFVGRNLAKRGGGCVVLPDLPPGKSEKHRLSGRQPDQTTTMKTIKKKRIRVMVVDDRFLDRIGLTTSINVEPDMVVEVEAVSGEQAIAAYRQHRPDIVLMDPNLPGMSGVEATRAICKEFPGATIIMFATHDGEEDIYRSLQAGARAYLLKTVSRNEVISTIRAVHSGNRCISPSVGARLAEHMSRPNLTAREIEVLGLIVKGKRNKEIASELSLAENTIKIHVGHIFAKLSVTHRTQATTAALQRGLVRLE